VNFTFPTTDAPSADGAGALPAAAPLAANRLLLPIVKMASPAKQLNDRLEEIKEKLKRHAASQPRIANAVLLRAGKYAVKCGY